MAEPDKKPVTMEELLVSSLAQIDALAKLLIEKGLITQEEFMQKISEERATYQKVLEIRGRNKRRCRRRRRTMRCVVAKSTKHLMGKIRTLAPIISIVFVFGSTPVFARGGGHSGGGHGGGHSGGHGSHSGRQGGHPGGHAGGKHGRITSGTTDEGLFHEPAPLPLYWIRLWRIAPNSPRSSGRRFLPKRPRKQV